MTHDSDDADGLVGNPVIKPRMEVDSYGPPPPNLQLTWFDELHPVQQYFIARHLYQYLEDMGPDDLELIVRSPKIIDQGHEGSWLEFFLCQTIARSTERFKRDILEAARAWSMAKVDMYAQEAKESAEKMLKQIEQDQNFCAGVAMKRLQQEHERQKAKGKD